MRANSSGRVARKLFLIAFCGLSVGGCQNGEVDSAASSDPKSDHALKSTVDKPSPTNADETVSPTNGGSPREANISATVSAPDDGRSLPVSGEGLEGTAVENGPAIETIQDHRAKVQSTDKLIKDALKTVSTTGATAEETKLTENIEGRQQVLNILVSELSSGGPAGWGGAPIMPWEIGPRRNPFSFSGDIFKRPESSGREAIAQQVGNGQMSGSTREIELLKRERLGLWMQRAWKSFSPDEQAQCTKYASDFADEASGRNAESEKDLSQQIQANPQQADLHFARAQLRSRRGNVEGAIEDLSACAGQKPENLKAVLWERAQLYEILGDTESMLTDLDYLVRSDGPEAAAALVMQGKFYLFNERIDQALANALQAVDKSPDSPAAHRFLADVYVTFQMVTNAIESLENVVRLAPDNAHDHYVLGNILSKSDRKAEAIACYTKAAEVDPSWWRPLAARATLNALVNDDWQSALEDLNKAAEVAPDEPSVFRNRAAAYDHLGRFEEARADKNRADELQVLAAQ